MMRSFEISLFGIITALLSAVTRWVYIRPMRSTVPSAFCVLMKLPATNGLAIKMTMPLTTFASTSCTESETASANRLNSATRLVIGTFS